LPTLITALELVQSFSARFLLPVERWFWRCLSTSVVTSDVECAVQQASLRSLLLNQLFDGVPLALAENSPQKPSSRRSSLVGEALLFALFHSQIQLPAISSVPTLPSLSITSLCEDSSATLPPLLLSSVQWEEFVVSLSQSLSSFDTLKWSCTQSEGGWWYVQSLRKRDELSFEPFAVST